MEMPGEQKNRLIRADLSREPDRVRFDYDCITSSVAKFLKGKADRIKRQRVTSTIQIGKALIEAKHRLSHGEFVHWVEGEAGIPTRPAQDYTRVASWASSKGASVAHLASSTLCLLSASSTPKDFVSDVLGRIRAGESVPSSVLRRQLAALRTTGIATDEAVLSAPFLAKNLERAFARHDIASPTLVSARRNIEERMGR
jgi:hypothetical protein